MKQRIIRGSCAAAAILAAASSALAEDVTVDFEDVAVASLMVVDAAPNVASNGFNFHSNQFMSLQNDGMTLIASNGTTTLHSLIDIVTMTHIEGELFTLRSIDVGEASNLLFTATAVIVTGTVEGGGLPLIAVINLDMIFDGPGGLADLQTYNFDETWTNLTSVTFIASTSGFESNYVLDNLVTFVQIPIEDDDGDGVPDEDDVHPDSDIRPTVWVGDVNTNVPNRALESGWTMADQVNECLNKPHPIDFFNGLWRAKRSWQRERIMPRRGWRPIYRASYFAWWDRFYR